MDYWTGIPGTGPGAEGWGGPLGFICKISQKEKQNDYRYKNSRKKMQKDHKDTQYDYEDAKVLETM